MGLSARTDDNTGRPLGEGFISLSTSAGNLLTFSDPASANQYLQANKAQFNKSPLQGSSTPDGDFNEQNQRPT